MKFAFTIVILACWSKLSIAIDDVAPESLDSVAPGFINYVDELKQVYCYGNLINVNFSNAVITKIGKDFISSNLLTCLDLSNNTIETIADGAFSKAPALEKLILSNNNFATSNDLFTFGSHKSLQFLNISNAVKAKNRFVITIPGSYPNLETLLAYNNGFDDIRALGQTPFPKLKILDLSSNNMGQTEFVNLLPESLEFLYLRNNWFTSLTSFRKASSIIFLTLDNNQFEYLGYPYSPLGLSLNNLYNLTNLSVAGNRIHSIGSEAFRDCSNLTYLNLSTNAISSLYPETFANLKYLKTLDLSHNKFEQIINISVVTNIIFLSLSCNEIQSVPEHAFKQMPKLRQLWLNGNQIKKVDINGFAYLNYLEKLDLSNNKLSSLPEGWVNAFKSLQFLDLSKNQFTSLESLSLSNKLLLVEVYLAMNPLKYLNSTSFNNLPKNVTVNLEYELHENVTKC